MARGRNGVQNGILQVFPVKTFLIITLLASGLVGFLWNVTKEARIKQYASKAEDLNTANDITYANNPDWTMGPATSNDNFSHTIDQSETGRLAVHIGSSGKKEVRKEKGNKGKKSDEAAYENIFLTITKAEVHLVKSDTGEGAGANKWETLELFNDGEPGITIDLMDLANKSALELLGLTDLAPGKYSQIRLYISDARIVFEDEREVSVTIPGKSSIVKIVRPFEVNTGEETDLVIDFDGSRSIIKAGDRYLLKPVIGRFTSKKTEE